MSVGGFHGRVLLVDLSSRSYVAQTIPRECYERFLGGRGVAASLYYDRVPPSADPLGPENELVLFTGPLTGIGVPCGTKTALSTKSPLTGHYLCSNAGGDFGARLKAAGYDGLIIRGKAATPQYLRISDANVDFCDASAVWEGTCSESMRRIREETGDAQASVICIGPAGEKRVRFASVMANDRAFGRGGAGAVLGAKNLKAVAVCVGGGGVGIGGGYGGGKGGGDTDGLGLGSGDGWGEDRSKGESTGKGKGKGKDERNGERAAEGASGGGQGVPIYDRETVRSLLAELVRKVRDDKRDLAEFGTSQLTEVMNRLGCYPARNFRTSFFEGIDSISARAMKSRYWVRDSTCYRCPIACGKVCEVKEGAFSGAVARPEYESTWAFGGQCGVGDFSAILAAIHLCDEYGLDAMTCGYVIGFAMDLAEEGLIKQVELNGAPLRFGDPDALVRMVHLIGRREGLGRQLGEGLLEAVREHPGWSEYAVHVKGMPFAGYDPRAFHGIGLTYGTSSRGACHNVGGWTISDELLSGRYDRYALLGKGELVRRLQDVRAFVDSSGVCTNARRVLGLTDKPKEVVLKAVTGIDFTPKLLEIGERIYNLERLCLNREGVTRQDDLLPARMSVPIPSGPAAGHRLGPEEYDVMLNEYYAARGWDADGRPTPQRLQELGL